MELLDVTLTTTYFKFEDWSAKRGNGNGELSISVVSNTFMKHSWQTSTGHSWLQTVIILQKHTSALSSHMWTVSLRNINILVKVHFQYYFQDQRSGRCYIGKTGRPLRRTY
jgi:hypothetical protein